jgi:methionine-rich copper-binding protein CopC
VRRMFVAMGGAVAAAVIWAPSSAMAHASLESSDPAQGATVQAMPSKVTLALTEPVQKPSKVEVLGPDGTRVNSQTATVLDNTVTSVIEQPTTPGTYRMNYSIVSVDDHTVTGTIEFKVLTASAPPNQPPSTPAPATPSAPAGTAPSEPVTGASPAVPGPSSQTQVLPDSGGSTTTRDAITIVGFSVITMTGLVLLLRAGLKSADAEDDD